MKWILRIVLGLLAIPALIFAAGFFGVVFGILDAPEQSDPRPETESQVTSESTPYRKPIDRAELSPDASDAARADAAAQGFDLAPLPQDLDETLALGWLSANRLLVAGEAGVTLDRARFSTLTAEQALKLLWAFKTAQNAATGDRKDQMRLLAGYVFMGAAYMPEAQRLAFAQKAQSVAWPGSGSNATRSGEFVLMFYLKDGPDAALADVAIRQFVPMLPGADVLSALERTGAIRVRQNADDIWQYDLDRIAHLSPQTLQVLLEFMGPYQRFGTQDKVDFAQAKERLEDLIQQRKAETAQ